jgi:hypothetical protein
MDMDMDMDVDVDVDMEIDIWTWRSAKKSSRLRRLVSLLHKSVYNISKIRL